MMRTGFFILAAMLLLAPAARAGSDITVINSAERPKGLPFSMAIKAAGLIFLAGHLGRDAKTGALPADVESQTRLALENISRTLGLAGSSLERVVRCTVYLSDMADFNAVNRVYATFFPEDRMPARTTVAVTALARQARIEIACTALAGGE